MPPPPMRVRFLGTGTSTGVPMIGCGCATCASPDERDRRTRHGLLIETGRGRLLVDTPPELRLQLIAARQYRLDAVFLSHPHADHVHGIDDLRVPSNRGPAPLPFHVAGEFEEALRRRFPHAWADTGVRPRSFVPQLKLVPFRDRDIISPAGLEMRVVRFPHGQYRSYGFRAGGLGVIIDASAMPDDAWDLFAGVDLLIVNALWFGDEHPAHFSMEDATGVAIRLEARRTFITHIAHRHTHEEISRRLPAGVEPAHDGLEVEL